MSSLEECLFKMWLLGNLKLHTCFSFVAHIIQSTKCLFWKCKFVSMLSNIWGMNWAYHRDHVCLLLREILGEGRKQQPAELRAIWIYKMLTPAQTPSVTSCSNSQWELGITPIHIWGYHFSSDSDKPPSILHNKSHASHLLLVEVTFKSKNQVFS